MGMHSIYIQQLVQPVAAPLLMRMHGYTGGVATVRVLPYPAVHLEKFYDGNDMHGRWCANLEVRIQNMNVQTVLANKRSSVVHMNVKSVFLQQLLLLVIF